MVYQQGFLGTSLNKVLSAAVALQLLAAPLATANETPNSPGVLISPETINHLSSMSSKRSTQELLKNGFVFLQPPAKRGGTPGKRLNRAELDRSSQEASIYLVTPRYKNGDRAAFHMIATSNENLDQMYTVDVYNFDRGGVPFTGRKFTVKLPANLEDPAPKADLIATMIQRYSILDSEVAKYMGGHTDATKMVTKTSAFASLSNFFIPSAFAQSGVPGFRNTYGVPFLPFFFGATSYVLGVNGLRKFIIRTYNIARQEKYLAPIWKSGAGSTEEYLAKIKQARLDSTKLKFAVWNPKKVAPIFEKLGIGSWINPEGKVRWISFFKVPEKSIDKMKMRRPWLAIAYFTAAGVLATWEWIGWDKDATDPFMDDFGD